jgi:hypothetical protein
VRRATTDEIAFIKDQLPNYVPNPRWVYKSFWEQDWPSPSPEGIVNNLEEHDWRYYVISSQTGHTQNLVAALDLAPIELETGLRVVFPNHPRSTGVGGIGSRIFHVLEEAWRDTGFFVNVSSNEIATIQNIYVHLQWHDKGGPPASII